MEIGDMTFNRLMYDAEFKRVTRKAVFTKDLIERNEKTDHEERFTIEKLIECKEPFDKYLKTFGTELPVHTRYSWVNSLGNKLASKSHFIRTNQPYAKLIRKIIEEAIENNEKLKEEVAKNKEKLATQKRSFQSKSLFHSDEEVNYQTLKEQIAKNTKAIDLAAEQTKLVIQALEKIKYIHNEMVEKKIYGEIRTAIENILNKFKIEINITDTIFKLPDICDPAKSVTMTPKDIIKRLNTCEKTRLSPIIETMLIKSY